MSALNRLFSQMINPGPEPPPESEWIVDPIAALLLDTMANANAWRKVVAAEERNGGPVPTDAQDAYERANKTLRPYEGKYVYSKSREDDFNPPYRGFVKFNETKTVLGTAPENPT